MANTIPGVKGKGGDSNAYKDGLKAFKNQNF